MKERWYRSIYQGLIESNPPGVTVESLPELMLLSAGLWGSGTSAGSVGKPILEFVGKEILSGPTGGLLTKNDLR